MLFLAVCLVRAIVACCLVLECVDMSSTQVTLLSVSQFLRTQSLSGAESCLGDNVAYHNGKLSDISAIGCGRSVFVVFAAALFSQRAF